jgi:hypothetical protein
MIFYPSPDPGSRGQKGIGSRICNTALFAVKKSKIVLYLDRLRDAGVWPHVYLHQLRKTDGRVSHLSPVCRQVYSTSCYL